MARLKDGPGKDINCTSLTRQRGGEEDKRMEGEKKKEK